MRMPEDSWRGRGVGGAGLLSTPSCAPPWGAQHAGSVFSTGVQQEQWGRAGGVRERVCLCEGRAGRTHQPLLRA